MKSKKFVFSSIFALILIGFTFALGEFAARLWGPEGKFTARRMNASPIPDHQRTGSSVPIREPSEDYHHNLIPNTKAIMYRGEEKLPPIYFEINSLGIRGPEIKEKPLNGKRILIIRDSIIEARLINFEETVGQALENKFNDEKIDIIQHGVSSWSPLLELNWYIKTAVKLKPDIIILCLVFNDFFRAETYSQSEAAYEKQCIKDKNGYPAKFIIDQPLKEDRSKENKPISFIERLGDKSHLIKWIYLTMEHLSKRNLSQKRLNTLMRISTLDFDRVSKKLFAKTSENKSEVEVKKDILQLARPQWLWDENISKAVNDVFANLIKFRDFVRKDDGCFIVTLIPMGWNFKDENIKGKIGYHFKYNLEIPMGGIEQKAKDFCKINNIQYIDLYTPIKEYKKSKIAKLYFPQDGHWNEIGHKVVSDILYETLFSRFSNLKIDLRMKGSFSVAFQ